MAKTKEEIEYEIQDVERQIERVKEEWDRENIRVDIMKATNHPYWYEARRAAEDHCFAKIRPLRDYIERLRSQLPDVIFEKLSSRKKSAQSEEEFRTLAKEFRAITDKDYQQNAVALAKECEERAVVIKEQTYEKLLQTKKQADAKTEPPIAVYRILAGQFSEMGPYYKAAATLSEECERIAFAQEQKNQYNNLLTRKSKAQSEDDFRILANEFRAMGDYQDAATLAKECETRYQKLKNERIHAEYTNASTTMQRLTKIKTRKPDSLRNLAKEWEKLACEFMTNADYKDASALAKECTQKSEKVIEKAKRIERIPRVIGRILQAGVFASFLYILFWTEIVRGSVRDIISITLANNIPDTVYLLPLILPLFFLAFTIGYVGSLFIKKKRRNYLFYLSSIIIQAITFVLWVKEYRGEFLPVNGIFLIVVSLATVIIPGAIIGMMKRKTATITLLTVLIIALTSRYGYYSGWFDNYSEKRSNADGMAAVKYGNFLSRKWGFMDEYGKEVIPCIYSNVLNFSEGLAAVRIDNKENGKWGFINKEGNEIVSFKYDAVEPFSEGLAKVRTGNAENGKWGFIDRAGTEVVPCKYNSIGVFSEGLALVSYNAKWGFIDKNGKEVIPCKYDSAESFSEGLALVNSNNKCGFIDKFGRIIITLKYDAAKSFSDGYAQVGEKVETGVRGWNFKWGLIDRRENLIVPYKYDRIDNFVGDLAVVRILTNNPVAVSYKPDKGGSGHSPRVYHRAGVVNKKGEEIIPCAHYSISIREDEIYVITLNGRNQYFDKTGRVKR